VHISGIRITQMQEVLKSIDCFRFRTTIIEADADQL